MDCLSSDTISRLRRLPQLPGSVWEGDRLALNAEVLNPQRPTEPHQADCFVWVDGEQHLVRGIDAVMAGDGPTAFVESLLKAMEAPLSWPDEPAEPQRPGRVVVRDRELHFLLRGMLRELDICVEYQPQLPLVDELLPGLQELMGLADDISTRLYDILARKAYGLWETAPWQRLLDSEILSVEIKALGLTEPLYVSVTGRLGLAQGVILYRSLDSLTRFRAAIVQGSQEPAHLQAAFEAQDCLFLNYEPKVETPFVRRPRLVTRPNWEDLELDFGSICPKQGLRSRLDLTELSILYGSLEAIQRFWQRHGEKFQGGQFPPCKSRYKVQIPRELQPVEEMEPLLITVKTQPVLARAFAPGLG
jgi:hypothetical protein